LDDRFVDYYRTRTLESEGDFWRRPLGWLSWVRLEIDNISLALQKCLDSSDWQRGLDIAIATAPYWSTQGTRDGRRWFDQLLAVAGDAAAVPARAYRLRGMIDMRRADAEAARPWLVRATAAARAVDDRRRVAEALATSSIVENMARRPRVAAQLLEEAESIADPRMPDPLPAQVLQAKTVHAFFTGDVAAAGQISVAGEQLCRASGDLSHLVQMLLYQGQAAILTGDIDRATTLLDEALRVARQLDDRPAQFDLLTLMVWPASTTGQARLAAQLLGAAGGVQAQAAAGLTGPFEPLLATARQTVIDALGVTGFEAAFAAGQRMARDDALRLALGETPPDDVADRAPAGPLAPREVDVAELVGEGLTNKQIAGRLFISDRTVATHVRNIMNKLGFDTRAQIAAWTATRPHTGPG
ncbi:MAG TPA: LuxR C-terminal-related transcriptional regulator, partial [Microlunatus sp.]